MEGRLGRFIDRIRRKNAAQEILYKPAYRIDPWPTLEEIRQRMIEQAPENARRLKEARERVLYADEKVRKHIIRSNG